MRKIRKFLIAIIAVCLVIPGMATVAHAASAEFRFSDPSTSVGAEVDVTAKVTSAASLNTVQATLNYDPSKLKFISGDDATGSDGTINLSRSDSEAGSTMEFNLKFQALQEGNASVEVEKVDGIDDSGVALQFETGASAITIAEGDPSLIQDEPADNTTSGVEVNVGKAKYTVTDDFSDTIIPTGFVRDTLKFEGEDHQIVKQESSGAIAMYLTPVKEGESDFFLYDSDTGKFSPLEVVEIAKNRYIVPLADDGTLKLSEDYQKTTLTLNGKEFDTWQDTKNAEYYIIYAMNSDGEKTTYRYDTTDGTYQKYLPSENTASVIAGNNGNGVWGKVLNFVENFLDIVVIIALALIIILVLVLIVTSVKLYHRDLELDDLYDEYGIDMDEEEAELKEKKKEAKANKKTAKKEAKKAAKKEAKKVSEEDEFEGFDDDDFDEEDPWKTENIEKTVDKKPARKSTSEARHPVAQSLDESGPAIRKPVNNINIQDDDFEVFAPLDEEEFDNFEGYYGEEDDDDYDLFGESDYEDDDMFDETSDLLSNHPEKIRSHAEMDDTFKMDVIDLD